jgi:carbon-monoxide dehydrogenase large subunit
MAVTTLKLESRWTGQPLPRVEDKGLLIGQSQYVGDIVMPNLLFAAFLRSPHAHARIDRIDCSHARALAGVVAVVTGNDVRKNTKALPLLWEPKGQRPTELRAMAVEKTLYMGHPVAMVVATSRYVAEDAVDLISVEYEPLPAVMDAERALDPGAPLLYEHWNDNLAYAGTFSQGDVEEAFRCADRVLRRHMRIHRHTAIPIEGRGALADFRSGSNVLTLYSSTQVPHAVRTVLSWVLEYPEHLIRVIAPEVGGAFGAKDHTYGEEVCLSLLSRRLGRPIQWIEDRHEHFLSTNHAREQYHDVEIAFNNDGTIVGIRDRMLSNLGAHISHLGIGPAFLTATMLTGPYKVPHYHVDLRGVVTNKVPSGSYRGWGQPQATLVMERLIDLIAADLGFPPEKVRFINMLSPWELPYTNPGGQRYDSGNYPAALWRALSLVDYEQWRAEQIVARDQGRYLGVGIGFYVECTSFGPSRMMGRNNFRYGGWEVVRVQVHPGGRATIYPGVSSQGQGHATFLAQITADELGINLDATRVVAGDTDVSPYSFSGTVNSRTATLCGSALRRACEALRQKCCRIGAHLLGTTPENVDYKEGKVMCRDDASASLTLAQVAQAAYLGHTLPEGDDPGLEARETFDPEDLIYPYGVHIAVVEVMPQTGELIFHRYVVVHDCGTMINPLIVEGQLHGGIAQGIGAALLEELAYDESGQLLTTTFMDYLLPTSMDIPHLVIDRLETPSPLTAGGMKGVGESGAIGPPAAIANAVADALRVDFVGGPLKQDVIWKMARGSALVAAR